MRPLSEFFGTVLHDTLLRYVEALPPERRDLFISARECRFGGSYGDPDLPRCLVEICEPETRWMDAPISRRVGDGDPLAVPYAFDVVIIFGPPFVHWLKAEMARANGSAPEDVARLLAGEGVAAEVTT